MGELSLRRKRLFSGSSFSSALLYSGEEPGRPAPSFLYFAGFAIDGCYLLLKPSGAVALSHAMNYRMAKSLSSFPVRLLGKERAKEMRRACGRGKVGLVPGEISAARYLALRKSAKLRISDATARVESLRAAKGAGELSAMRQSAKIARSILDSLDPWECSTELELASRLKSLALAQGTQASFEPIVATGKNSSFPHHVPAGRKLGNLVLVDFGVKKNGYCSDFTRCYFRESGTREEKSYLGCRQAFAEILDGLPDCGRGRDVARLAGKLMKRHALPKMVHAIGHGIGLEVHEFPHLGEKSNDLLCDGTVLAIEPAAYYRDYGVRFEEMVAKTDGGWALL